VQKLLELVKRSRRVYIIGNGGSYANASHIANDLLECGIKAYTLDASILTAWANDYGYEHIFKRWMECVGEPGDLLIALSGSGKSRNILNAVDTAKDIGMDIWRIYGADVGADMQHAEEMQLQLGHKVMKWLKNAS